MSSISKYWRLKKKSCIISKITIFSKEKLLRKPNITMPVFRVEIEVAPERKKEKKERKKERKKVDLESRGGGGEDNCTTG